MRRASIFTALIALLVFPSAADAALWRLDETSGTVAADAQGTADGTYAGGPASAPAAP